MWRRFSFMVLGAVVLSVLFSLPVLAQQDDYCQLIHGRTTGTNIDGGFVDFDAPGVVNSFRACAKMRFLSAVGYDLLIDGWAWNENLGWVAMGAFGDAAPFSNSGVDFSAYEFSSFVKYVTNQQGQLRGWWWNDAAGWILLHCLDLPLTGCRDSDFGAEIDGDGNVTGYAWSDSMGWIDLTGMRIPTPDQLAIVPEIEVMPIPSTRTAVLRPSDTPVYANYAPNAYTIGVSFDLDGQSLLDDFDFDFDLQFLDQVMSQQVSDKPQLGEFRLLSPANDLGNARNFALTNKERMVSRFTGGNDVDGFREGGTDNFRVEDYEGKKRLVTRVAMQSMVPTKTFVDNAEKKLLKIVELNYVAKKKSDGEVYTGVDPVAMDIAIDFKSPVVTTLAQGGREDDEGKPYLNLILGPNERLLHDVRPLVQFDSVSSMRYGVVIHEPSEGESNYVFCMSDQSDDFTDCELGEGGEGQTVFKGYDGINFLVDRTFGNVPNRLFLYLQYFLDQNIESLPSLDLSPGTGVYAYVQYVARDGRVYNYLTGRLINSAFQVFDAKIQGNTRLDAFRVLTDQGDDGNVGERTGRVREAYLRYAQAVLRGRQFADGCDGTGDIVLGQCALVGQDLGKKEYVYGVQHNGSSTRVRPVSLTVDQLNSNVDNNVVVVIGRDVIVEDTLFFEKNTGELDRTKNLTLLVFKNGAGNGGNVYVRGRSNVLQANIFADGSMFSVSNSWAYPADIANRVPFRDEAFRRDLFEQFVLVGSLASKNTVGGCDLAIPRLGDGRIVERLTIEAREEACLYDLNYFRYSPMIVDAEAGELYWPEDDASMQNLSWQVVRKAGQSISAAIDDMWENVWIRPNADPTFSVVNMLYDPPAQNSKLPVLPSGFTFAN